MDQIVVDSGPGTGDCFIANVVGHRRGFRREAKEAKVRSQYANAELGLDINDMRPRLAEKGLEYKDYDAEDSG